MSEPVPVEPARILVVDDVEMNRDLLARRVRRLGHEVLLAEDGVQALALLRSQPVDVLLLDIMMPNMNGYEVLETMAADEALRRVPVIMISAIDEKESIARCIELGADDYLPKPFDPLILQARLGASLARRRLHDREQLYQRSLVRELEIGREIQAHFLPGSLPSLPGFEFAARLRSARMVGGDFYDLFPLGGGREVVATIGDVCDKGVGAALFMALFRSLLRALAEQSDGARWNDRGAGQDRRRDAAPREDAVTTHLLRTVTLVNDYVAGTHDRSNMFATVFFAIVDGESGLVQYINAGHEPPVVLGPHGIRQLAPTGPALGLMPGLPFEAGRTILAPGETLVAWTDGVTEARTGGGDELFGDERALAAAGAGDVPAEACLDAIVQAVDAWAEGVEQSDDITLLAIRRLPAPA
ncbi:MAG TPA: SpoIIE family protein phosphatase [Gemmatimonadales bacterium]|nr:SpoIIE family protein phosphatase [Gemmatimonadales bacterium]